MIQAHFLNIRTELLKELNSAEKSLKIAVAWFTNHELFDALLLKCKENISVELILINDSINLRQYGLDFNEFINRGGSLYFGNKENLMHHKFCIIDDKVLINGSYNWTYWAESKNKENITIFKNEENVLQAFNNEFRNLVAENNSIETISDEMLNTIRDEDGFFDVKNIKVNEYLYSAIDLGIRGNQELSMQFFEKVNKINPVKASSALQIGVANNVQAFKNIYDTICTKENPQHNGTSYEAYCDFIWNCIKTGKLIDAIGLANACIQKFPGKFSVHVYCGDAKTKLNDLAGAIIEYKRALRYRHQPSSKILYYNKSYNYLFFPHADIYLKMGLKEKAIETLKEAVRVYKQINGIGAAEKAEKYLNSILNDNIPLRIE